ncbi:hypothetical protein GCM10010954_21320 [Halobacillus andaensis]|uniref:Uncharacterized protein n=1 Tax=Halobacillus andaensis TaxID=1176239 RepID=A0A917B5I7_HALAA|nr:hypothetical protein [Halobacillus andaensis]MBP2004361.1 hypothetical protein [Halobacillus andaensis]GGF22223.1 hypothetical protein GCM10010954_21320 [Halobacillus andaensis]
MDFLVPLAGTLIFGFLGAVGFYHAFKRYNPDDHFLDIMSTYPTWMQFVAELFLWMTKKLFPEQVHRKVYRAAAFLFGVLMCGFISIFWIFR